MKDAHSNAERFGSGDGERKTLLTRQIAFEPLSASVLFGRLRSFAEKTLEKSLNTSGLLELVAIGSDRFGRAGIGCFHHESDLFGCLRLAQDVGPPTVVVLGINGGDNLHAKVAVNAGIIYVELAGCILWNSSGDVSHEMRVATPKFKLTDVQAEDGGEWHGK